MKQSKGLKLETSKSEFLKKDLVFSFKLPFRSSYKLNDKRKEFLYIEMYSMLEAGIDLKKTLDIIGNQQKKIDEKAFYSKMGQGLINGLSLWETMKNSGVFTPYEYYCIQIGEESGELKMVLKEMADFFNNKLKLKKQLAKSISYPIVIIITSFLAVGFMMAFIVPVFTDMFIRFDGELPAITSFLINVSSWIKENGKWVLILFVSGILILRKYYRRDLVRKRVQFLASKIPYFGGLIKGIYYARFCSSMSLLIGAKVPLLDSMGLVKRMVGYYPVEQAINLVEKDVLSGSTMHESFRAHKVFDEKNLAILGVGEEVNRLDLFFEKLHQRYMEEVEVKTQILNTYLEPIIIMGLGVVIGFILIAMYLPMFKLSSSMGL